MRHLNLRILAIFFIFSHIVACASTTTMHPMNINNSYETESVRVENEDKYIIKFTDGREQIVYGNALRIGKTEVSAYSYDERKWVIYPKSEIEDIYLEKKDYVKERKNRALITGAAVLTAFVAASAGGYFLERELR